MDRGLQGKAALVSGASKGIGRAIVQRLVAEGMQVLGIARGGCDVPGAIGLAVDLRDPAAAAAAATVLAKSTGVARFGEPEEIAAMVAFLASAEAGYIQGAILDIDGGWNRAT